jgi:hypothetical protein
MIAKKFVRQTNRPRKTKWVYPRTNAQVDVNHFEEALGSASVSSSDYFGAMIDMSRK